MRPLVDLVVAGVAGAALGAPLLLPGTQVGGLSLRNFRGGQVSLGGPEQGGPSAAARTTSSTCCSRASTDLPVTGTPWFADRYIYIDTVAYVGVIAVVLAVLALAKRWRDPEVLTFGAITVVMAGLVFASPLVSFLDHLPFHLGGVLWYRAVAPMALGLAVLAGVGTDVARPLGLNAAMSGAGSGPGFAAAGLVLAALWLFGRGHLPPVEATFRAKSFIWPAVATAVGLGAFGVAHLRRDRRAGRRPTRRVGVTGRHVGGHAPFSCARRCSSSSPGCRCGGRAPTGFTPTPAVVALRAHRRLRRCRPRDDGL